MTVTVEDYDHALEGFIDDVQRMEGAAESVLLFGSMARGGVRPGVSDLMDAYIVLRPEVFEDKERFLQSLQIMMQACDRLQSTGLPFHPFGYIGSDEVEYLPAKAFSIFPFEPFTKVVWGTDVLSAIRGNTTKHFLNSTRFYEGRSIVQFHLARYLYKQVLTEHDCQTIIEVLLAVKKDTYMAYMALMDRSPTTMEPIKELEEALPGLDTSVLRRIEVLKDNLSSTPDVDEVRRLVDDALLFMEDMHSRILATLSSRRSEEGS